MTRKLVQFGAICLTVLWAVPAMAQNQPWKAPNGAVESRVQTCTFPQPLQRIAMDDFQFSATTVIKKVRWWGVVLDPNQAQLQRRFYIAIWGSAASGPCPTGCNPSSVLASWCLTPSTAYAGLDCQNRKVYRFTVCLPGGGFTALTAFKYWLQISEIDSDSARPGVEDFRWSGYRDPQETDHTRLCDAQQRDAGGAVFCTIFVRLQPSGGDRSFLRALYDVHGRPRSAGHPSSHRRPSRIPNAGTSE